MPISGLVIAASLFWSPFIAIGLLPLVGVLILQNGVRPFLCWQNLLVAPPLALLLAGFLSSAAAQYPRGWIWEGRGWLSVLESGELSSTVVFLSLALLLLLLRPELRRDPVFLVCLVAFAALSLYTFGFRNDWGKHAPLPALVVLCAFAAATLVHRWGEIREWYRRGAFAIVIAIVAVASLIGAVSYGSSVYASRDLAVFRYERLERHETLLAAVTPRIQGQHVVQAAAWLQLLLKNDGPDAYPDKGRLIIDSDYRVFLNNKRLVYVRPNCSYEDTGTRFILHVIPVDTKS